MFSYLLFAARVAKCQGYGRYISVKILETWGKIFESNKKWLKMAKNGKKWLKLGVKFWAQISICAKKLHFATLFAPIPLSSAWLTGFALILWMMMTLLDDN